MDVEVAGGDQNDFVVGGSGTVFSYGGTDWSAQDTPTSNNLDAVVLVTSAGSAIAVGDGGAVIECQSTVSTSNSSGTLGESYSARALHGS